LSQLLIKAEIQSRFKLKTTTAKVKLGNWIIHIVYLLLFHLY